MSLSGALLLAALCGAWLVAGAVWFTDLAANLTPSWALPAGAFGLVCVFRRHVVAAGLCAGAVLLAALAPLMTPRADSWTDDGPPTVSVLVHNTGPENTDARAVVDQISASGAHVVGLVEPSRALLEALRTDDHLLRSLPFRHLPERADTGYKVVLSAWPIEPLVGADAELARGAGVRAFTVDAPSGPFVFLLAQAHSPRTHARWRDGNAVTHALSELARSCAAGGKPLVIAADLNSAPAGWRSRELGEAGLLRCKPRTRMIGTYPAALPPPLRLAIDDVWVSPHWSLLTWRTLPAAGSDHAGVHVELVRPLVAIPSP